MARGGQRNGAGRKKGSATRRTREVADAAAERGITPLEVMLEAMLIHHQAKEYDKAVSVAAMAAPYIHPRLTAVSHEFNESDGEVDAALDAEIERLLASRQAQGNGTAQPETGAGEPVHNGQAHP